MLQGVLLSGLEPSGVGERAKPHVISNRGETRGTSQFEGSPFTCPLSGKAPPRLLVTWVSAHSPAPQLELLQRVSPLKQTMPNSVELSEAQKRCLHGDGSSCDRCHAGERNVVIRPIAEIRGSATARPYGSPEGANAGPEHRPRVAGLLPTSVRRVKHNLLDNVCRVHLRCRGEEHSFSHPATHSPGEHEKGGEGNEAEGRDRK